MSHIVRVKVEMKNKPALLAAADKLGLKIGAGDRHKLFSGQEANGTSLSLPGWKYPLVVNTESGEALYDNYGGTWGKQVELDKLVQRYAIEVAAEQALLSGFHCQEEQLSNGDIEVTMERLVST